MWRSGWRAVPESRGVGTGSQREHVRVRPASVLLYLFFLLCGFLSSSATSMVLRHCGKDFWRSQGYRRMALQVVKGQRLSWSHGPLLGPLLPPTCALRPGLVVSPRCSDRNRGRSPPHPHDFLASPLCPVSLGLSS